MNRLEDFLEQQIRIKTSKSIFQGQLKNIDDVTGALIIQQKDEPELKVLPYSDIISCELNDSTAIDTHDPAVVQVGECIDYNEKTNFFSEPPDRCIPNFIQMSTKEKESLIQENYENFGPKKEITAYIAAIYTVNYLRNKFLKDIFNKKICIIIDKKDWFVDLAFYISRVLLTMGYQPELISTPVNQKTVRHLFYCKKERQMKKDQPKGDYDLALIACDSTKIASLELLKAKNHVFLGIPQEYDNIKTKTGIFYGPYDVRYNSFDGDLVFVQSGLSRNIHRRMGLDDCPFLGYIEYNK